MLLLLRRMVLAVSVVLALASAGLGVAFSLSLTPSSAIVQSIPVWEAHPTARPDGSPQSFVNRDIV